MSTKLAILDDCGGQLMCESCEKHFSGNVITRLELKVCPFCGGKLITPTGSED